MLKDYCEDVGAVFVLPLEEDATEILQLGRLYVCWCICAFVYVK
jgi:hypothetical protein